MIYYINEKKMGQRPTQYGFFQASLVHHKDLEKHFDVYFQEVLAVDDPINSEEEN
jgi:hypothetical protein